MLLHHEMQMNFAFEELYFYNTMLESCLCPNLNFRLVLGWLSPFHVEGFYYTQAGRRERLTLMFKQRLQSCVQKMGNSAWIIKTTALSSPAAQLHTKNFRGRSSQRQSSKIHAEARNKPDTGAGLEEKNLKMQEPGMKLQGSLPLDGFVFSHVFWVFSYSYITHPRRCYFLPLSDIFLQKKLIFVSQQLYLLCVCWLVYRIPGLALINKLQGEGD